MVKVLAIALSLLRLAFLTTVSNSVRLSLLEPHDGSLSGPLVTLQWKGFINESEVSLLREQGDGGEVSLMVCITMDTEQIGCVHSSARITLDMVRPGWHNLSLCLRQNSSRHDSHCMLEGRDEGSDSTGGGREDHIADTTNATTSNCTCLAHAAARFCSLLDTQNLAPGYALFAQPARLPPQLLQALTHAAARPLLGPAARDLVLGRGSAYHHERAGEAGGGKVLIVEPEGSISGAIAARSLALSNVPMVYSVTVRSWISSGDQDSETSIDQDAGHDLKQQLARAIIPRMRSISVGGGGGGAQRPAWVSAVQQAVLEDVDWVVLCLNPGGMHGHDRARAIGLALGKAHRGVIIPFSPRLEHTPGGVRRNATVVLGEVIDALRALEGHKHGAANIHTQVMRTAREFDGQTQSHVMAKANLRTNDEVRPAATPCLMLPALPSRSDRLLLAQLAVAVSEVRSSDASPISREKRRAGAVCDVGTDIDVCLDKLLPERATVRAHALPHYENAQGAGADADTETWTETKAGVKGRTHVKLHFDHGMNAIATHNACLEPFDGPRVHMYRGTSNAHTEIGAGDLGAGDPVLSGSAAAQLALGMNGFAYGWDFVEHASALPGASSTTRWWYSQQPVLVARPAWPMHTSHFAESILLLFHAALHAAHWQWLGIAEATELWLPTVSTADLAWNRGLLDVVLTAAAEQHTGHRGCVEQGRCSAIRVRYEEDIRALELENISPSHPTRSVRHCFARLSLLGAVTHEFGLFADVWEAQLLREAAWRRLALLPPVPLPPPATRLRTFVVERRGARRQMLNRFAVLRMLQETGLVTLDYPHFDTDPDSGMNDDAHMASVPERHFEDMSFRRQVAWMQATDVLIAVHGGGLLNALWMRHGAVAIDVLASSFVEFEWANQLASAGIHYLFVPTRNTANYSDHCEPHPELCRKGTPYEAGRMACIGLRNCDVAVWLGGLEIYLRQAAFLIRNVQRRVVRRGVRGHFSYSSWPRGSLPDGRFDPLPPIA